MVLDFDLFAVADGELPVVDTTTGFVVADTHNILNFVIVVLWVVHRGVKSDAQFFLLRIWDFQIFLFDRLFS